MSLIQLFPPSRPHDKAVSSWSSSATCRISGARRPLQLSKAWKASFTSGGTVASSVQTRSWANERLEEAFFVTRNIFGSSKGILVWHLFEIFSYSKFPHQASQYPRTPQFPGKTMQLFKIKISKWAIFLEGARWTWNIVILYSRMTERSKK